MGRKAATPTIRYQLTKQPDETMLEAVFDLLFSKVQPELFPVLIPDETKHN